MDGKPSIKVMSKTQLFACLKPSTAGTHRRIQNMNRMMSNKRSSTPLISTSISTRKKSNHPSAKKVEANNFMTVNNVFSLKSCNRLISCQTMSIMRPLRKQNVVQLTDVQRLLLKNSDKIRKIVWNQNNDNLVPLVISADFIMDQDSFWYEPKVNPSINRTWKELHRKYFVIWIVKSERGFRILKQYAQKHQLALNSVFIHQRKQRLTVDYIPLKKQILKVYGSSLNQIIIVECLKLNTKQSLEANSFIGKVPLTFDSLFKVCYLRCQSSAQGLGKVAQICKQFGDKKSQKLQILHSIRNYITDYFQQVLLEKFKIANLPRSNSYSNNQTGIRDEDEAEQMVQNYRKELIDMMIRQKGRGFQHEGFSINYIVGDIIKRNYYSLLERALDRQKTKVNVEEPLKQMQTCAQPEIEDTFFQYLN